MLGCMMMLNRWAESIWQKFSLHSATNRCGLHPADVCFEAAAKLLSSVSIIAELLAKLLTIR